jgi:hypothetical protein
MWALFGRVYIPLKLYTAGVASNFPHRSSLSDSSPNGRLSAVLHSVGPIS